jgi:outer membrane protein TolC
MGLTLNVPLFASGQTTGKSAELRNLARRASWLEESATQKSATMSAQLLGQITSAQKQVDSLHRARFAAEANRRLAEGRYAAGAGSIIEVIDAEILYANVLISEAAGENALEIAQAQARAAADLPLVEK